MRRSSPENIYQAKRAGLRGRMVGSWHAQPDDADRALDGWDLEAATRGLARDSSAYWSEAEPWLRDECGVSEAP